MTKRDPYQAAMPAVIQPGPLCFTLLGLALAALFWLIVRLAERPTTLQAAIALALVFAPRLLPSLPPPLAAAGRRQD